MNTSKKQMTLAKRINHCVLSIEIICLFAIGIVCYGIILPRLTQSTVNYNHMLSNQIASEISLSIDNLMDQSNYIMTANSLSSALESYNDAPNKQNYSKVCLVLQNLVSSSPNIRAVIINDENGNKFDSVVNISEEDLAAKEQPGVFPSSFSPVYNYSGALHYGTYQSLNLRIDHQIYTFYFFYKVTSLIDSIETLVNNHFDAYVISDFFGNDIYRSSSDFELMPDLSLHVLSYQKDHGYYCTATVSNCRWYFTGYSDMNTLYGSTKQIFLIIIIFSIVICVLIFIAITFIISHFMIPLKKLNQTMTEISSSRNMNERCDVQTNDEIGTLSQVFNSMLDSIQDATTRQMELQYQDQQLKYNLLIAQIDSHFISNTMTIINTLAREHDFQKIIEVNTALHQVIQNTLRIKSYTINEQI